ncbi:MAG: IclR family transcriptional regulator [Christensenellales bacterium]|jgi:DNA-binding IclR family transcriptional regulator
MENTPYVKSILKALRILDIFGFDDPLNNGFTLSELSKRTGIAANTLCKILKTLVRAEYLSQDAERRYHSSHKTSMIHMVATPHHQVAEKTGDIVRQMCALLGVEAYLTTLSFGERKTILKSTCSSPINPIFENNQPHVGKYIYTKATGRVLVSYANSAQLKDILNRWGYPGYHWDGISNLWELVRSREQIRQKGYCVIHEEDDRYAIAVPVKAEVQNFVAALGAVRPIPHDTERHIRRIVDVMRATAQQIAQTLILTSKRIHLATDSIHGRLSGSAADS